MSRRSLGGRQRLGPTRAIDAALWALAGVLLVSVVVLSLIPRLPVGGPGPIDLLLHAAAYAPTTLSLLLAGVWRPGRGEGPFPKLTVSFIAGILALGMILELVQAFGLAGVREGEIADALANGIGVGAGAGVWALARARTEARSRLFEGRERRRG